MSDENKEKEAPKPAMTEEERQAKIAAAAAARAARAAAKETEAGAKTEGAEGAPPKEPSHNQPKLERFVQLIKEHVHPDAVVESSINERDFHLPYVVVHPEHWFETAKLLKANEQLDFNYLRNLSGVDQETHIEVVYHLLSMNHRHEVCIKVKTDREQSSVPSVQPVWATADWNEREVFDLLGVDFPGHPNMKRIMMPDDWVGYPLRKDYEPIDPEV